MTQEGLDVQLISARRLAAAMVYRGLSVRELAQRVGAHRATIGHLRSGKRTYCDPVVARRIAKTLDYPIDEFFVPEALRKPRYDARGRAA